MGFLVLGDLFYGYDYIADDIFELSEYIKEKNLCVILNLEGAITQNKSVLIKKRGEHLAQSIKIIEVLKLLNVKGVSLSNNHIYDFGEQGLKDTIETLNANGIKHCGAGLTKIDALKPMVIENDGMKFAFYGATDPFEESVCSHGDAGCLNISDLSLDNDFQEKDIKKIALLHTGFEYNTLPNPRTIEECHNFIDIGFDAVICSHPHITQPYETYNKKYIYYSLGNFYFSTDRDEFQEKNIYEKKEGYCNIGLGVIINSDGYKTVGINYDPIEKKSFFDESINPAQFEYEYKNSMYKKIYMKNRNNYNPMLTGDLCKDNIKMSLLNTVYKIYGIVRIFIPKK